MISSVTIYDGLSVPAIFASFLLIVLLVLCAGFSRKRKDAGPEPVRLISKHEKVDYVETSRLPKAENGHVQLSSRKSNLRTGSPNWRNSSLSRELPAIPDGMQEGIQSESASNVYACLDDVRVNNTNSQQAHDPQSSDSSQEHSFPIVRTNVRVHPYDKIGGPSTSSAAALSQSVVPNSHAQILQQLDNDPGAYGSSYGGVAQSVMSYTSITVRTPLTDLRARRTSEDGYTKVSEENHLYAQVGEEYGGSAASEQLDSHHIYNELYSEIDVPQHPPQNYGSTSGSAINPYATSRRIQNDLHAGASTSAVQDVPSQEDLDKLYAKIQKPTPTRNIRSASIPGSNNGQLKNFGASDDTGTSTGAGRSPVFSQGAQNGFRHYRSSDPGAHVSGDFASVHPNLNGSHNPQNGPKVYIRKEHVYEQVPDT